MQAAPHRNSYQVTVAPDEKIPTHSHCFIFANSKITHRPTAERLLAAFCDITLYHYRDGTFDITSLNDLHKQILSLMAVPESVYDLTKISTRLTN